jgi:hypothetical protein
LKAAVVLHGETVSPPNARTRQYNDRPPSHGSAIGTAAAGDFRDALDQTTAFPARKVLLVESSNW